MTHAFSVIPCDQRSPEWQVARLGRLTSSAAADMLATGKGGKPSTSRRNLLVRLVLERLTGRSQERVYVSPAMQQGIDREAAALRQYEALTGQIVQRTGFLAHPTLLAGASLDGHVGDFEGIVEAKSPLPATHLEYLRSGVVPADYLAQCRHALWITGAAWCDWLSYNPDFPEALQVKIVRLTWDSMRIGTDEHGYGAIVRDFLAEVDTEYQAVRTMAGLADVLQESLI